MFGLFKQKQQQPPEVKEYTYEFDLGGDKYSLRKFKHPGAPCYGDIYLQRDGACTGYSIDRFAQAGVSDQQVQRELQDAAQWVTELHDKIQRLACKTKLKDLTFEEHNWLDQIKHRYIYKVATQKDNQ